MHPMFYNYWTYFDLFFSTVRAQYNQFLVCSIHCHYTSSQVLWSYFFFFYNDIFRILYPGAFVGFVFWLQDLFAFICTKLHFFYFVFKPSHLNYLNVSVSSKGCLISFPILLYNFIVSVIAKPIVNLIWIIFYSISTWCVVSKIHFWEFLSCSLPISSCGQNE